MEEEVQEIKVSIHSNQVEKLRIYLEENELEKCLGFYDVIYDGDSEFSQYYSIHFYYSKSFYQAVWELETIFLLLEIDNYEIEISDFVYKDYWEDYKKTFPVTQVSKNFYIVPDWLQENPLEDSKTPIIIKPGLSFGTGLHESTQLMLRWIDDFLSENYIVLDAGSGSGILSIAALKKNAKRVYCFDIDENSIIAIHNNLILNFKENLINQKIFIFHSDWNNSEIQSNVYDVILANMNLPVFLKNHNIIKKFNTQRLVVSGIINDQKKYILPLFESHFDIVQEFEKNDWILIDFKIKNN